MKKIIIIILAICLMVLMSACSYTAFEESIKDTLNKSEKAEENSSPFAVLNEDANNSDYDLESEITEENSPQEESKTEKKERIIKTDDSKTTILKGIGESYSAYFSYTNKSGVVFERGTKGVVVTLEDVEVFDSFYNSGVELNSSILELDGTLNNFNENVVNNSAFILVDMTFLYTAPKGEEETCVFDTNEFVARWIESDKNPEKEYGFVPMYLWFSHPADGSDDRIDTFHNKLSVVLNDGEPFSCQLGIFTDPQYIEDKNVYILLFTMGDGSVEGYKHKYFELFPNK